MYIKVSSEPSQNVSLNDPETKHKVKLDFMHKLKFMTLTFSQLQHPDLQTQSLCNTSTQMLYKIQESMTLTFAQHLIAAASIKCQPITFDTEIN